MRLQHTGFGFVDRLNAAPLCEWGPYGFNMVVWKPAPCAVELALQPPKGLVQLEEQVALLKAELGFVLGRVALDGPHMARGHLLLLAEHGAEPSGSASCNEWPDGCGVALSHSCGVAVDVLPLDEIVDVFCQFD